MRRVALAAVLAAAVAGCQTSKVSLLPDEDGGVGAVAVLDVKTEAERTQLAAADTELKSTKDREGKPKRAKAKGFASLFGGMPKPPQHFRLYFETGKVVIAEESKPELAKLLELWTRVGTESELQVTGYTDTVGEKDENDRLSLERAQAVLEALRNQGFVFDGNSRAAGRGERDLLVKTDDDVDEPRNRRVEITVR